MFRRVRRLAKRYFFVQAGAFWVVSKPKTKKIQRHLKEQFPSRPGEHVKIFQGSCFVRVWPVPWATGSNSQSLAVQISPVGRLGNLVLQLGNAAVIARQLTTEEIWLNFAELRTVNEENGALSVKKMQGALGMGLTLSLVGPRPRKPELPNYVWRTIAMERNEAFFLEPNDADIAKATKTIVASAIEKSETASITNEDLVIHVRGGDTYTNPHPRYGPPPWAFYQRVLESRDWRTVWVVSEDATSPALTKIENWCTKYNIPFTQSGTRVAETIGVLWSAPNIVISAGTFVPAICFIYGFARNLYFFDGCEIPIVLAGKHQVFWAEDRAGDFREAVLSNNWQATEYQKELILSYPLTSVGKPSLLP